MVWCLYSSFVHGCNPSVYPMFKDDLRPRLLILNSTCERLTATECLCLSVSLMTVQKQSNFNKKSYLFLYRSVVNGIMAQVASNLKTTVDVTDLAFRTGSHIQLIIIPYILKWLRYSFLRWISRYVEGLLRRRREGRGKRDCKDRNAGKIEKGK